MKRGAARIYETSRQPPVVKALRKIGYRFDRQRGSHMILRQQDPPNRRLTVPDHQEVARGTLRAIIRQAGLTVEEFKDLP